MHSAISGRTVRDSIAAPRSRSSVIVHLYLSRLHCLSPLPENTFAPTFSLRLEGSQEVELFHEVYVARIQKHILSILCKECIRRSS